MELQENIERTVESLKDAMNGNTESDNEKIRERIKELRKTKESLENIGSGEGITVEELKERNKRDLENFKRACEQYN